ncbi:MAG: Chromate transporter [Bacillota bacterium]|jgi:chromate transporter|nr:Chromate transporter [Bacillota bacterium]
MAYFNLFYMFFKIGLFSFGGGYAMLPLIFQSVQDFGIMSAAEFSRLVAISQVTPGPIAVNAATFVGFQYRGYLGAAVATAGVALPSLLLILITMHFMKVFQENQSVDAVLKGIRPATVGLIASAVIFLAETSIFNGAVFTQDLFTNFREHINLLPMVIFLATIVLAGKFKISPIKLTLLAGLIGAVVIK